MPSSSRSCKTASTWSSRQRWRAPCAIDACSASVIRRYRHCGEGVGMVLVAVRGAWRGRADQLERDLRRLMRMRLRLG